MSSQRPQNTGDTPPAKKQKTEDQSVDLESLPGPSNGGKSYTIERVRERRARKFHAEDITFRAKFNEELQGKELLTITQDLHDMFNEVMENVNQDHPNNEDKARLNIRHSGLEREIVIHCQPKHNITSDVIMER